MPQAPLRPLTAWLAFGLIATWAAPALAGPDDDYINPDRPGIADGSTSVGRGHFQIETAFQREFRDSGDDRTTFIPTLLRYGFADKWEVRVESNTYSWEKQVDPAQGASYSH